LVDGRSFFFGWFRRVLLIAQLLQIKKLIIRDFVACWRLAFHNSGRRLKSINLGQLEFGPGKPVQNIEMPATIVLLHGFLKNSIVELANRFQLDAFLRKQHFE
jgi:hypothetical protein